MLRVMSKLYKERTMLVAQGHQSIIKWDITELIIYIIFCCMFTFFSRPFFKSEALMTYIIEINNQQLFLKSINSHF